MWRNDAPVARSSKAFAEIRVMSFTSSFLRFFKSSFLALPLFTPLARSVYSFDGTTAVETDDMTRKLDVADKTIYFETRWAKQVRWHIILGRKRRRELHEVSTGKCSRLECTGLGDRRHIKFKEEKVGTGDSKFRLLSAKVKISSADFNSTVLKDTMTKYYHIFDGCFQDQSKTIWINGVSLKERSICYLQIHHTIIVLTLESQTSLLPCSNRRKSVGCLILQKIICALESTTVFSALYRFWTKPKRCKNWLNLCGYLMTTIRLQK